MSPYGGNSTIGRSVERSGYRAGYPFGHSDVHDGGRKTASAPQQGATMRLCVLRKIQPRNVSRGIEQLAFFFVSGADIRRAGRFWGGAVQPWRCGAVQLWCCGAVQPCSCDAVLLCSRGVVVCRSVVDCCRGVAMCCRALLGRVDCRGTEVKRCGVRAKPVQKSLSGISFRESRATWPDGGLEEHVR